MANQEHRRLVKQGASAWNAWRQENPDVIPDLRGAVLSGCDLHGIWLSDALLSRAKLQGANLSGSLFDRANLSNANCAGARLDSSFFHSARLEGASFLDADLSSASGMNANFKRCDLRKAAIDFSTLHSADFTDAKLAAASIENSDLRDSKLTRADLREANLQETTLRDTNLDGARIQRGLLAGAYLEGASLRRAQLQGADLEGANLDNVDLRDAVLSTAVLRKVSLVETNVAGAVMEGCAVYGLSAWGMKGTPKDQRNLVITPENEASITVDNLEVAQFVYLLLNNASIRRVIDTITSKVVLILGRFTDSRKSVLDVIRAELRKRDYSPVIFDFSKPRRRDLTETVSTLAHLARFVIADITQAKSIPQELQTIVPNLPSVPVQPIIASAGHTYGMFEHFTRYPWVLPLYKYRSSGHLVASMDRVIGGAEGMIRGALARERS